jgi:hypothetical protein
MLNLVDPVHALELRVFDNALFDERFVQGNVNVPIDRGRDELPTVLEIIRWQISAAASK